VACPILETLYGVMKLKELSQLTADKID